MYGGISLAIYMHGVAQELLRLVRATSGANLDDDKDPDEVAQIYQKLSTMVHDQRPLAKSAAPGQEIPRRLTRFVVDILSGTSAGGINAVFLAKALALRSRSLDHLRRTWLDMADIDKILNRGSAFEPMRSLLNGDWMYKQLHDAFCKMNTGERDPQSGYTAVEQLDLFVTTTDLNGVWIPLQLTDMNVPEPVHAGCFHFRYDNMPLSGDPAAAEVEDPLKKPPLQRNDFTPDLDAMLAFACRCTSSFPIAFAPMKLADIAPLIGQGDYRKCAEQYRGFFSWIPREKLVDIKYPLTTEERELADGGFLDDKPFDHAIDAMAFRAAPRRHTRKLLFIDPFPKNAAEASDQGHFDFFENTILGSITLPHDRPIRDQINRIKASNRLQERLQAVQDRTMTAAPRVFPTAAVRDLAAIYGPMYQAYHAVRLFDCTDDLAYTFGGLPEGMLSEDAQLAVRYVVRAWRDATYAPNPVAGRKLETQFFDEFDSSFRMRRARHLLEWAQGPEFWDDSPQPRNEPLCDLLVIHLTRLHRKREQLALSGPDNPVWDALKVLGGIVTRKTIARILQPIDDDDRLARAAEIVSQYPEEFRRAADAVSRNWNELFSLNRRELKVLRDNDPDVERQYSFFDYHDMVSLTFLEGSDVSEHTETEIYRISPADGIQRPGGVQNKLAGYGVDAFGAFLKLEWRQNDILWGRLDTCERLVSAVLTHPDDKALRDKFVSDLRSAIIRQEADLRSSNDLEPALRAIQDGRLADYLTNQYTLAPAPAPSDSARRLGHAADIFGRVIEDDLRVKSRVTGFLRSFGSLAVQVVALLTPGKLGRVFLGYWLELLGLSAVLVRVYGWLAGDGHAKYLGNAGLALVVVLWLTSWAAGSLLGRPRIPFWVRSLKWPVAIAFILVAIAFIVVILIGVRHWRDVLDVWRWLWRAVVSP
jgi:patatin-related protein